MRCLVVFVAQILGAIAAAGVASALFPGPMAVNTRLGGGTSIVRGVFIEMFATILLVLAVVMLAAVKHKATYLAPIGIGIALFVGHLCSEYINFVPVSIFTEYKTDSIQVFTTLALGLTPFVPLVQMSSIVASLAITGYTGLALSSGLW
jgi:hypothetical protein